MNSLFLRGELFMKDEKPFIKFRSNSRSHYLPINSDGGYVDGDWVELEGSLVTKSFVKEDGKYGKIWVAEGKIDLCRDTTYANAFTARGTVVKVLPLRVTPLTHRKIVDFVVACGDNYYNCIAFGSLAEDLISNKKVGNQIDIRFATFQSRVYQKNGITKTAYEIVVRRFD